MTQNKYYEVNSSFIRGFVYNSDFLEIYFKDGSIYKYSGMPFKIIEEFALSDSHSAYYNKNIKGIYHYIKERGRG